MSEKTATTENVWTGERVRALRERYGESARQFSERIGVHINTLYAWELDRSEPIMPVKKFLEVLEERAPTANVGSAI